MIVLPPVNQIASGNGGTGAKAGDASSQPGVSAHQASANSAKAETSQGGGGAGTEPTASSLVETSSATDSAGAALTRISLPKDGQFGAVVLGSSASDLYPEGIGLGGRLVYTVYLRVGLRKSWILQYCLPKGPETDASAPRGSAIDAPWPFLLFRPDELTAPETDYIIVHGLIGANGRFEQLALVSPESLPENELLLGALRQWRFRPASRDGQAIAVEALLVIPRDVE